MLINNDNHLQYTPYDIIAVDESFRKFYDRSGRVYQLDIDNPPPLNRIVECPEGTTISNAFDNDDWLRIEHDFVNSKRAVTHFRHYIHKSIREAYLTRTEGKLVWEPQYVYEIVVGHQRVTLTNNNFREFSPRMMMAFADSGYYEIIDENGDWFLLGKISRENLEAVFPNYKDFKFERDESFFHMGLGTGMWVDKSIVQRFAIEAQKIYTNNGSQARAPYLLHPIWKETVWRLLSS